MAINYSFANVFDPAGSTATNTQNIMSAIKTAITANAAWSLVEDVTVGTAQFRWMAFKCSAAGSGLPNDFYVVFTGQTTSNTLNVYIGEAYTGGSGHTLSKYASVGNAGTYTPASDGTASPTLSPSATGAPTNSATPAPVIMTYTSIGASATYVIAVYPDHLVLYVNTPTGAEYIGAFTSLVGSASTNDPMPLVGTTLQWTNSFINSGSTTRHPLQGGVASANYLWSVVQPCLYGNNLVVYTWASPYIASANIGYSANDLLQNSSTPLSEALLTMYGGIEGATTGLKNQGYLRGKYKNLVFMAVPPAGLSIGDQIVYNGTHWMCISLAINTAAAFIDLGF